MENGVDVCRRVITVDVVSTCKECYLPGRDCVVVGFRYQTTTKHLP